MVLQSLCACGNQAAYQNCCEPYLSGQAFPPTAEALMRSRYTAYSKGNIDYLIATLHPRSRQKSDRSDLLQSVQSTRWVGLTILDTQKGQAQDKRGVVEFVAMYQSAQSESLQSIGRVNPLHERSRFVKERHQWLYVDGDILPPNSETLASSQIDNRNDRI
jgi:SEC-C motif domain protein